MDFTIRPENGTGQSFTQTSEKFTEDAAKIYALYDIAFDPVPPSTSFCKERAFHYRLPKLLVIRTHQSVRLSKK